MTLYKIGIVGLTPTNRAYRWHIGISIGIDSIDSIDSRLTCIATLLLCSSTTPRPCCCVRRRRGARHRPSNASSRYVMGAEREIGG